MINKNFYKKIIFSVIMMVLWMGAIFYLSAQPAVESKEVSGGIMKLFTRVITYLSPSLAEGETLSNLHFLIRKSAHFLAFFILACLVLHALNRFGYKSFKAITIAFLFCVIYAMLDEYHQTFVPGRSGELRDVFIDSAGAFTGIVVYSLIHKIIKRKK
jgi:VanZ family protein